MLAGHRFGTYYPMEDQTEIWPFTATTHRHSPADALNSDATRSKEFRIEPANLMILRPKFFAACLCKSNLSSRLCSQRYAEASVRTETELNPASFSVCSTDEGEKTCKWRGGSSPRQCSL